MTHPFDNQPFVFATSIMVPAHLMPDDRRGFFLEWLCAHDAQIACARNDHPERIYAALVNWFASMTYGSARHAYQAVVRRICRWESLKTGTQKRMPGKAEQQ